MKKMDETRRGDALIRRAMQPEKGCENNSPALKNGVLNLHQRMVRFYCVVAEVIILLYTVNKKKIGTTVDIPLFV